MDVTVLEKQAAVDLLEAALYAARPKDDRLRGDLVAAGQLAEICGGLPLALQIAAALLKADPALSAAELADELSMEAERLEQLQYDDGSGLDAPSVATAFELSYRRLDHTTARLFRLLPLNPGPDVLTAAMTAMAAMPAREVRKGLAGLAQAHLADAAPNSAGRWRIHDLLRLYAQRLSDAHADEDSREQATDRLLGYYLTMAQAADDHLRALRGAKVPTEFSSREVALAWLDAERTCLVAAVTRAAETGRKEVALHLPMVLADYFQRSRRFDDELTTMKISLEAARRLDDRLNEAMVLTNLGETLGQVRRFQEAISAHRHAAAVFQEIGHNRGKGMALDNLGIVMQAMRRFQEAISAHWDAVIIFRESGDRHSEGMAMNNLGAALYQAGRSEEAVTICRAAVAIYQKTGDRRREANALNNLGEALRGIRRFKEALIALEAAVAVYRETGDQYGEGRALANVGSALVDARQFEEAVSACQAAAAIFRDANDRHGEGIALNTLGNALLQVKRSEEAITALQGAAAAFRDTSDQYAESVALRNLERATSGHPT